VDRLHRLLSVRSVCMQQLDFNNKMRVKANDCTVVAGYRGLVSDFTVDKIRYEHSKSLSCKNVVQEHDDGTYVGRYRCSVSECTYAAYCGFHLPCRHIFMVRHNRQVNEIELSLVAPRWLLGPISTVQAPSNQPQSTETVNSVVSDISPGPMCATSAQRFKTLMAIFTPMASALADLPQSQFPAYMSWVRELDKQVRDGSWAAPEPHREPIPSNDGSESAAAPASDVFFAVVCRL